MMEKRGLTIGSSVVDPGFKLNAVRNVEGSAKRVVIL
jgi:hypothetical protein